MQGKVSKSFFLISFLPAIAYWYLESNYPIRIAVAGGVALAIFEILFEKIFTSRVHSLSRFNFFLITFLGGLSLIGQEGVWFKLQPCITGIVIGLYILYRSLKGRSLLFEMMESMNQKTLPREIFQMLEIHISCFFVIYGLFMGGIALFASTDRWLFFKTAGFYIIFFLFFICEVVLLRYKMRVYILNRKRLEVLSRF